MGAATSRQVQLSPPFPTDQSGICTKIIIINISQKKFNIWNSKIVFKKYKNFAQDVSLKL
jgi:hypothetical protein